MISDALGNIDYDESGRGPTLVLVPGSCSTGAAWRPVIAGLGERFRCISTSLLGYGGTRERRDGEDCSIAHEVEVLERVVRTAASPVHLVGHSFGGLVAIALVLENLALARRLPLASLAVLEAPALSLLREAEQDQHHYRSFQDMTDSYFAAFAGGDAEAVRLMIDFYGGLGTFASWPRRVRTYAMETTAVNIRDWASVFGFALSSAMVRLIDVPSLIAWGACSHPAARRANSLLGASLRAASSVEIAGAAHFMISTHASEVARHIANHVWANHVWANHVWANHVWANH
ncbi:MAG TPA: alpha/beta hydrolase, partial [Hyphomicrobiaceae bacterium]|nr:alpha/beta hydrolase [Hyphomicrobiaceae bacterium]